MASSVSLKDTLQLATIMFPISLNTNNSGKGNNEMEKNKKVSGKVKYNLKIENLYLKNKRQKIFSGRS